MMIPKTHPRRASLLERELLVEGFRKGATALEGLIAFGRGETFDYLLGERTSSSARGAVEAAAALLITAENPVISVNGNTGVLCPKGLVELSHALGAKLEINLFYRIEERVRVIEGILRKKGAKEVYGVEPDANIPGLESERGKVSREGIHNADVVLVALEDGDRTEALVKASKKVVAIDLNPLSRTSRAATITIVDNIIRALPILVKEVARLKSAEPMELERLLSSFNNQKNLRSSLSEITEGLNKKGLL